MKEPFKKETIWFHGTRSDLGISVNRRGKSLGNIIGSEGGKYRLRITLINKSCIYSERFVKVLKIVPRAIRVSKVVPPTEKNC